jgi:hypothetical protein
MRLGRVLRSYVLVAQSVFALTALLLVTGPALGTPIFFSNRNQFDRSLGPHEVIDFEDVPVGPVCLPLELVPDACSLRIGSATFSATGPVLHSQRPQLIIQV